MEIFFLVAFLAMVILFFVVSAVVYRDKKKIRALERQIIKAETEVEELRRKLAEEEERLKCDPGNCDRRLLGKIEALYHFCFLSSIFTRKPFGSGNDGSRVSDDFGFRKIAEKITSLFPGLFQELDDD